MANKMKAVVQRVEKASVSVQNKILNLRIFPDENKMMSLSLLDKNFIRYSATL